MAKRKTKKRRRSSRSSLSGLPGFETNRISQKSVISSLIKPVAIGLIGAAAGHFAGKSRNLLLAGAGGIAAIAMNKPEFVPAVIGCAVVTPSAAASVSGIDGLDGLKEVVSGGGQPV